MSTSERDNNYGRYGGRWPAIVREYHAPTRMVRVEIPGLTDGAEHYPWAEIEYPIGDKSIHDQYATEIEILPNDTVWVAFVNEDPRYPIVTGYRNARTANSEFWRRWHHLNISILATNNMNVTGKWTHIKGWAHVRIDAGQKVDVMAGSFIKLTAPIIYLNGDVVFGGGASAAGGTLRIDADIDHDGDMWTSGEHIDENGPHDA